MKQPENAPEKHSDILIYQAEDGRTKVSVRLEDESAWLPQIALADLFETSKQNVSLHIRNILEEGELEEGSVVKDYLTTAADGKRYRVKHYNLDMILAVGYRVRSPRGIQFRQWATERTIKKRLIVQTEGARERLHHHEEGLRRRNVSQHYRDASLRCLIGSVICRIVSRICRAASIIHGKSSLQHAHARLKYHAASQQSLFASRHNHHETLPPVSFSCISCVSWSQMKATP